LFEIPVEVKPEIVPLAASDRRRLLRARMRIQVRMEGGHGTRDRWEQNLTSVKGPKRW
jgi:hypothetical protein